LYIHARYTHSPDVLIVLTLKTNIMNYVRLKVKGLISLASALALTIITMQTVFSQPINNNELTNPAIQLVSDNSEPIIGAIQQMSEPDIISIFPNPASENITIQSSGTMHSIIIFDILGRVVKQFQPDQLQVKINLQYLIPGKYFLKIQLQERNNAVVRSFVKL
jgi:hypothetical protein